MRKGPEDGRWYAYCVEFCATKPSVRSRTSRQTMAHYRRIAALPRAIGTALDDGGAPFYLVRWIAWGKSAGQVETRFADAKRFHTVAAFWPHEPTLASCVSLGDLAEKLAKIVGGKG